jgi:ERCC4-type nuclease
LVVDHVIIDKGREEPGRESPRRKQYLYDFGVPFIEQRLDIGDYLIGDYIVEYKSWEDLYASMNDGRLWEQLNNMRQYPHPMIAVVGEKYKALYEMSRFRRGSKQSLEKTIRSGLVTIYKSFPVPVMMFENDKEFCKFIESLFNSLNKEKRKYRPVFHKRKPKTIEEVKENVVAESRGGVSIGKAKTLLDASGYSIKKMIENVDMLGNVKGIGPKIVKRIKDVFE